ncbi:MAG: hypothetical protein WDM91_11235 [Rhizomicrobium sp.]
MPSLSVELPAYVITKDRKAGTVFYFQVPKRQRPLGWPGTHRLPLEHSKRTGLGDAAELAAVTADAASLYRRMQAELSGEPEKARLHTLPWLVKSFEKHLETKPRKGKRKGIAKSTARQYAWAARQLIEWSKESGHPHVRAITRPAVLQFLDTMMDKPTKRLHVAGYLRQLMFHAMDKGVRLDNPAIKLGLETPDAHVHIWTGEETETMIAAADEMGIEGIATAIAIAHDEGPRPGDIRKFMRPRDYTPNEGAFRYFQNKTNGWVVSPAGQRVFERLRQQPHTQLMLVINHRTSKKYNERVFARDFDRVREKTGFVHLQFRHLRHTFCVNGKRAGLDEFEIASKTGHSSKSVRDMLAQHYLPHDSVVATKATAKLEDYRRKLSGAAG